MPEPDPLVALSAAVADGVVVDWSRQSASADDLPAVEQLRIVEVIAGLYRAGSETGNTDAAAGEYPSGSTWGPLVILETLGAGHFGTVYRAHDPRLQRDVALKVLRVRDGRTTADSLVTEARLLARVRHPNVVTVYGADVVSGEVGLWMELVPGQTLASWVATHGPLGAEEAAVIGATLCRAVAAVHQAGLLHRDIKAQNVVREPGGRLVLMDFGAGWDRLDAAASPLPIGTPVYLAPEVLAGQPPSAASDLYSLGVLLFFLVTRHYPVSAVNLDDLRVRHARREQVPLRDLRPDLPSRFIEVVSEAIAIDPDDRFESAGRLERALVNTLSRAGEPSGLVSPGAAAPDKQPDAADPTSLAAGATLGAYKVVRPLASGGMGDVYLARDTRLDRQVALKVISQRLGGDPDRLARFMREARTASRLSHPNIAHIYEIGEADGVHFIAMEYVRGDELRSRIAGRGLPITEVIVYATQIADALDEAHTHGIVHRDLKPSNALVTARGRIKVLDFGLAKTVAMADPAEDGRSTEADLTDVGVVLGTVDYMSPEQVRGLTVDRRSDIFSFGVMLYEMIAGRVPFAGASKTDLVFRITQSQPEPLSRYAYDVPPELDRIVRKCLEKDADRRYQTARDLLVDLAGLRRDSGVSAAASRQESTRLPWLRWLAMAGALVAVAAGAGGTYYWRLPDNITSLAVLPDLRDVDGADAVRVAEAVANSISNSLSMTGSLRVAPRIRRSSAPADPLTEARELRVHGALLVSVELRDADAVLDLRLVDVDHHPRQDWGRQYRVALGELDLAQEGVAEEVAETLNLRANAAQRRALAVYQLVLRGHSHLAKRTETDLRKAIEFFQLAVDTDRSYARAWAGLAQAHNLLHIYSIVKPAVAAPAARAAAERALALDERLAEAHTQRALVAFRWEWDWTEAERAFERAVALDASDGTTRHWASMFQSAAGRFDDAIVLAREAQAGNPLDPVALSDLGWVLYVARRYDEAVAESARAAAARPDSILPHWYMGLAHLQAGRPADAVRSLERAVAMAPEQTVFRAELACALAAAGRRPEAARIRDDLAKAAGSSTFVPAYHLALISSALGDREASLDWLEAAARERDGMMVWVGVEPRFDALRDEPRFRKIVSAIRGVS